MGTGTVAEEYREIYEYAAAVTSAVGSHGMDHTDRVTRLCTVIGSEELADMGVLIPAAILHDIARSAEEERGVPHEAEGARMAEEYLRSAGYNEASIPAISHAIRAHRFRSTEKPETPEARILSDADKLDALGAVGIARTFIRAGERGGGIPDAVHHVHDKLMKLEGLMRTPAGRRIARERHTFMAGFMEELERERVNR
ncbi:MAG TPA: HD domain-containing protein [Methanoregula sp.]|nr:HD domain-containing protein [Methanoregula sp.]